MVVGEEEFAGELASQLEEAYYLKVERRVFPDGELCPRLQIDPETTLKDEEVVVSLRKLRSESINDYLMNYFLLLSTITRHSPSRVFCIMPYHAYSRQDNVFRSGEPLSSKLIAKLLEYEGVTDFLTFTSHFHRAQDLSDLFTTITAHCLSGIKVLGQYLNSRLIDLGFDNNNLVVIAPDGEAFVWAEELAEIIDTDDYGALTKHRDVSTGEIQQKWPEGLQVRGKDIIIVDDIVSTGLTTANAANMSYKQGAQRIIFAYVHAVHAYRAIEVLRKSNPALVVTTDTIDIDDSYPEIASVLPTLAEMLKKLI